MEFAVFAVKLGWSLEQYQSITPRQRRFILKEIENETVKQSELLENLIELAIGNAHRKKNKRRVPLWTKLVEGTIEQPVNDKEMGRIKAAFAKKFKKN